MGKNIKVIKNQEKPETREVLAEAIIRISEGLTSLEKSGLNRKAIVALIADGTTVGKPDIRTVLDALARLKGWYCK